MAKNTKAPPPKGKPTQTKAPPPPKPSESKALQTAGSANLPASLAERLKTDSGKGTSQRMEDNLVPMIVVVQKGSPVAEQGNPAQIEGVQAGMIWLKGMDEPFFDGEEGIVVQPCQFQEPDWVEWRPRGSGGGGGNGYVTRHAQRPNDAKEVPNPQNQQRKIWVRPNGNILVETRYHIVRVFLGDGRKLPYVIPLSSTGHTVSKEWMMRMNNVSDGAGGIAPSFAKLYRLTTKFRQNDAGTWYQLQVSEVGWVEDVADYDAGLVLHTAFEKGEKTMDTSQFEAAEERGGRGSNGGEM